MKLSFRWYGPDDAVPLKFIRQIPNMHGIVTAVYDTPPGEVWPRESIQSLKQQAQENGLAFEVVESVPVHEEIKLGGSDAPRLLENYCENLRRLGEAGVKVVCYNFMPVFDWLRSDLNFALPDGSTALSYQNQTVQQMDPTSGSLSLPGWDESYGKEEMKRLIQRWQMLTEEDLWRNLEIFLRTVVPVAEESGIKMAIHPDDPPWSLFGLPRIITCAENVRRLFSIVDSPSNGLTLCTGSFGAGAHNDVVKMADEFAGRIPFVHLRNVWRDEEKNFYEAPHPSSCGSLDLYGVVKALVKHGFDGWVRPDHGRMIWDEQGRPGYGLYDRALGAAYINGLFEAAEKELQ
ncbi:Mannonate dehydratase [uncultured Ruminococcus sp.]|uniref:Mannonate dehydratase n=1 Tax=Massiliimalia timonensis TaxID=1987501 RepID=A0A8J6P370_9FIRM|nr:mannonate dehydratase [Massiliimalia timonensis]MBC8611989.1 mannonate dehydratase [Massiliimalia timonensis]SCG97864.1 Mannonate dehydratase [uncultured Clostridium sp.]SCH93895.1 Mannonate dehydratase [uncultured Ruminococcus sp.]